MQKNIMYNDKKEDKKEENYNLAQKDIKSRIVFLSGGVDKDSAYKVTRSLLLLDEISNEPIKLFINSPGGEVNSGFSIFDCIRFLRSPVYVIGAGLVASAAALIYIAVPKKQRLSLPHSRYLLHQPLSGMRGVVTDLEIYSKEIESLKALLNNLIAKETDQKLATVEKDTDRDFWLNAQKAVTYGLVGKIVQNKDELKDLFLKPEKKDTKKTARETKSTSKKDSDKKTSAAKKTKKASPKSTKKTKK